MNMAFFAGLCEKMNMASFCVNMRVNVQHAKQHVTPALRKVADGPWVAVAVLGVGWL